MSDRVPLARAERYIPIALLAVVFAFMLWVRLLPVDHVITGNAVYFSGNDPWYHSRMVHLAVHHFPSGTPFDPWSYFPYGTGHHSGFGGLFDQLIALTALLVGLGNPSPHRIDVVTAIAPAVFGAATALPTYVISKHLTDRRGGLVAAALLALGSGGLLSRTIVGTADHQSAEAFFGTVALVGFTYAITVAYRESPMIEDVADRNWEFLRTPVLAGVAGGVLVASYLTMWPPGVMALFPFGVFVVVQLAREHYAGRPTDHLAMATVVAMTTTGVITLLYARSYTLQSTAFSLLQPLVAFGLAAGTVVLVWLSRYAEREGYDRHYYPPVVGGLILAVLVIAWLVYPEAIHLLNSLFTRIYSFGYATSITAGTVAEIIPPSTAQVFNAYGVILFLALVGGVLLGYRTWRENRPTDLLVLLWCFTMFAAYMTEARFSYYFSVVVTVLAGVAIWWSVTKWLGLDVHLTNLRDADVGVYQVLGVLVLIVIIIPGNVVAVSGQAPAWQTAKDPRLSGTNGAWYDGLHWLRGNSPAEPLDYNATYARPANGDYAYPQGAYGVMSWWDYGHWITVMGHRIPYANPFQQNPRAASAYLQATNETRANLIMDALPGTADNPSSVADKSTAQLQTVVANESAQQRAENGRYVAIDDQMAGGKFNAITRWAGPGTNTYYQSQRYYVQGQNVSLARTSQRYDQTMLSQLYFSDTSGLSHYRLVHEVNQYSIVGGHLSNNRLNPLTSLTLRGGWNRSSQVASQLQRARSRHQMVSIGGNQYVYNARVESRVKLFERVQGATLTGTIPSGKNATIVFAYVRMQTHTGRNFTYVQSTQTGPDGQFSVTVPYATDDSVSVADGGTNASVRAIGPFHLQAGGVFSPTSTGNVTVPETAIYEGRTIQATLQPVPQGNASSGNSSAIGNPSTGNTTTSGNTTSTVGNASTNSSTSSGDLSPVGSVFGTSPRMAEPAARPYA